MGGCRAATLERVPQGKGDPQALVLRDGLQVGHVPHMPGEAIEPRSSASGRPGLWRAWVQLEGSAGGALLAPSA